MNILHFLGRRQKWFIISQGSLKLQGKGKGPAEQCDSGTAGLPPAG